MIWIKRALLALPFGIAAALNLLAIIARPMHWHTEHIAGYGFLFATPWAWLIDHDWFGRINRKWLETLTTYFLILWVPAFLYSSCLCVVFRLLRRTRQSPGQ